MANLVGHETSSKITGLFCKEPYQRDSILQKRPMILRSLLIYFHETSRNTLKSALYHLENFSKISSISFCVVSIAASCRLRNVRAAFQVDSLKRQLALILHFFFFLVLKFFLRFQVVSDGRKLIFCREPRHAFLIVFLVCLGFFYS